MSQNRASEDAYVSALKWIWAAVAVTLIAGTLVWLTRGESTPKLAAPHSRSEEALSEPEETEDDEQSVELHGAQAPSPEERVPPSHDDAATAEQLAAEDAQANQEIIEYEENAEHFEERLARLERELEDNGPDTERGARFEERVRQLVASTTKIPVNVTTRCSETVCEVSLAGEGPALGFAQSASKLATQLSNRTARSSVSQEEALDVETLIAPATEKKDESSSSTSSPSLPGTDSSPEERSGSSEEPPQKVRSIRFLIDVDELTLPEASPSQASDGPEQAEAEE